MPIIRRRFLQASAAAAVALPARVALADKYPSRPVRLIVGFGAGGAPDILGRLVGQWLSERLGQPFVIENRVGADGNIATALVGRAAPDGYTLLEVTVANPINETLNPELHFARDIVPIASFASAAFVLVVNPSFPARTVAEFVVRAKAAPGKLNIGSPAIGTPPYLSVSMLKMMTGIDVLQVPYHGSPAALTDLMAGRVDAALADMSALEFLSAGKLRALGVTTAARQRRVPDVPTIGETVPGFEASTWYGLGAPKNTPADIVAQLNAATNAALAEPAHVERLAGLGFTVNVRSQAEFAAYIAAQNDKWGKVIRAANIKPE
ncbi:MAG TPA: tripartite tricarboxylate transporter substrate-binding protein [Xanthobacteraceae bacterium]|nr:tripartite tricarboxylate transporter substrate-binding protein [Xanthobacteraceae bacterium]